MTRRFRSVKRLSRQRRKPDTGHRLRDAKHLLGIAKFIVIPNIDDRALPFDNGCCTVNHSGVSASHLVRGNQLRAPSKANLLLVYGRDRGLL